MKIGLKSKKLRVLLYLMVLLLLVLWTIWGNTALMVHKITVSGERIPIAFSGFRIAQISDLHNAEFGEGNAELLVMLAETKPDIIAITGDLVDSSRTDIEIALEFAQGAVQIAPTYYVTGNHEAWAAEYDRLKSGLEAAGVVVLEDASVWLEKGGESIQLMGLDDPDLASGADVFKETPDMMGEKINRLLDGDSEYTILLSHRPELFETYVASGVDLVFSGHAHGGQFRLPFVGGLVAPNQGLFPKYDAGLYTKSQDSQSNEAVPGTNMVVSRGLGNSVVPLRFNNRPEIILVELNKDNSY